MTTRRAADAALTLLEALAAPVAAALTAALAALTATAVAATIAVAAGAAWARVPVGLYVIAGWPGAVVAAALALALAWFTVEMWRVTRAVMDRLAAGDGAPRA